MFSLLFLATLIAPDLAFDFILALSAAVMLMALYNSSSVICLTFARNKNIKPEAMATTPIISEITSSMLIMSKVPQKMLKQPLPTPVRRKKKLFLMQGILKEDAIMISPKMLKRYGKMRKINMMYTTYPRKRLIINKPVLSKKSEKILKILNPQTTVRATPMNRFNILHTLRAL